MQTNARGIEAAIGADAAWTLTIRDRQNNPITAFTAAAVPTASCWAGEDQAPLFAPAVSWLDPTAGKLRLAVAAAQTAGLAPGEYPLQLQVASGSATLKRNFGPLRLLPSPGTGVARPAYSTYADMARHAGNWLEALQRPGGDQAGFADERADARAALDDLIQRHYRGPSTTLGAFSAGPQPWQWQRFGYTSTWLAGVLASGGLLVTPRIREYCSLLAIGTVCRRQMAPGKGDDAGYGAAAAHYLGRADDLAASLSCEVDVNADGLADLVVHLGAVDSLRG